MTVVKAAARAVLAQPALGASASDAFRSSDARDDLSRIAWLQDRVENKRLPALPHIAGMTGAS